jgi:hypothetical protein
MLVGEGMGEGIGTWIDPKIFLIFKDEMEIALFLCLKFFWMIIL